MDRQLKIKYETRIDSRPFLLFFHKKVFDKHLPVTFIENHFVFSFRIYNCGFDMAWCICVGEFGRNRIHIWENGCFTSAEWVHANVCVCGIYDYYLFIITWANWGPIPYLFRLFSFFQMQYKYSICILAGQMSVLSANQSYSIRRYRCCPWTICTRSVNESLLVCVYVYGAPCLTRRTSQYQITWWNWKWKNGDRIGESTAGNWCR